MVTSTKNIPESMRNIIEDEYMINLNNIPHKNYDYDAISGRCCENVIGYIPIPLGIAGPILVNNQLRIIPMATTEGALIASVNRGCKVLSLSGGVEVNIMIHGITRAPMFGFPDISSAMDLIRWSTTDGFFVLKTLFESTTNYGKLINIHPFLIGTDVVLRISANTSEAMGMNIITKGVEKICKDILDRFPSAVLHSISSNMCVDKKPNMINWLLGRGRRLIGQAKIPRIHIENILKTTPERLVDLNYKKCIKGSISAGTIGGYNNHTANMLAAIFTATGQDLAQVITSSNCITEMEYDKHNDSLILICTLPSVELGTIGGGTNLKPQASAINLAITNISSDKLYKDSINNSNIGKVYFENTKFLKDIDPTPILKNVDKLAETICAAILAGELSLSAALATNNLVNSHMKYNRK